VGQTVLPGMESKFSEACGAYIKAPAAMTNPAPAANHGETISPRAAPVSRTRCSFRIRVPAVCSRSDPALPIASNALPSWPGPVDGLAWLGDRGESKGLVSIARAALPHWPGSVNGFAWLGDRGESAAPAPIAAAGLAR